MMKYLLIALTLITLSGCVSKEDPRPTAQYCEMTQIFEDTKGEFGWPDYKKIKKFC